MINFMEKKDMNFDYEINEELISIYYHNDTSEEIELTKFWKWIQSNELNEWVDNYYHPAESDGHRQESGFCTLEEYLDYPYATIKKDLETFLKNM